MLPLFPFPYEIALVPCVVFVSTGDTLRWGKGRVGVGHFYHSRVFCIAECAVKYS